VTASTNPVIVVYRSGPSDPGSVLAGVAVCHCSQLTAPSLINQPNWSTAATAKNLQQGAAAAPGQAQIESTPQNDYWSVALAFASDPSTTYVLVSGELDPFMIGNAPTDGSPITIYIDAKTPDGLLGAGSITISTKDWESPWTGGIANLTEVQIASIAEYAVHALEAILELTGAE
jgi:hypothetical protein